MSIFLQRKLHGLFIEDIDFLHHANLPITQLVTPSGALRPINAETMERILRSAANEIRTALQETASSLSLEWSFDVSRGEFFKQLSTVSEETDLLVVARYSKTNLQLVKRTHILHRIPEQTVVIFTGSPSSIRALEIGGQVSSGGQSMLQVLIPADSKDEYQSLEGQSLKVLKPLSVVPRYTQITRSTHLSQLSQNMKEKTGLFIIGIESDFTFNHEMELLSQSTRCPIILVR